MGPVTFTKRPMVAGRGFHRWMALLAQTTVACSHTPCLQAVSWAQSGPNLSHSIVAPHARSVIQERLLLAPQIQCEPGGLVGGPVKLPVVAEIAFHPRFALVFPPPAWRGSEVACLIRVPTEVVKQRAQANPSLSTYRVLLNTLQEEGFRGLYRGYGSTVLREIPFSLVQFPLWEYLKAVWWRRQGGRLDSWQAAVCGALAGGVAAFVTTPLDVAKTRIMLAKAGTSTASGNIPMVLYEVWKSRGIPGLFAGSIPRVTFISMGGFIFLGAYEKVRRTLL
ncbi:S-adenosylmethionine mitochondrial carrier protein [Megalobrama amblycephala]|uniref:S-adenosylmethionine mitochondrial carrier protein n=1 Tax=Megalobrama amblycephala TaxID=75352 RepID=UPI0020144BF9|nr:S-adenosylmethionine mitochondrial carrier protein [Megalobrama amblycephala]